MKYTILNYRAQQMNCTVYWTVHVLVRIQTRFLFVFTVTKTKWMSCGRDGHPRLFVKSQNEYATKDRMVMVESRAEAEQNIQFFQSLKLKNAQINL